MTAQCDKCMYVRSTVAPAFTPDGKLRMLCVCCRGETGATLETSKRDSGPTRTGDLQHQRRRQYV